MKIGDLIQVEYPHDAYFNGEKWVGILIESPHEEGRLWRMWCIQRNTVHILNRYRDNIEVLSEKGNEVETINA